MNTKTLCPATVQFLMTQDLFSRDFLDVEDYQGSSSWTSPVFDKSTDYPSREIMELNNCIDIISSDCSHFDSGPAFITSDRPNIDSGPGFVITDRPNIDSGPDFITSDCPNIDSVLSQCRICSVWVEIATYCFFFDRNKNVAAAFIVMCVAMYHTKCIELAIER